MGITELVPHEIVPELPSRSVPYPPSIGVLGEPIAKREYVMRRQNADHFLTAFAGKMRNIVTSIGHLSGSDVDYRSELIHRSMISGRDRAKAAWEIVAWYVMFAPYDHPKRKHIVRLQPFIDVIEKDAEALYNYAVYILRDPSEDVFGKLKALHPEYANMYRAHMRDYAIASEKVPLGTALFNW